MPSVNYAEPTAQREWPRYKSTKLVHALKLSAVEPDDIAEDYTKFTPVEQLRYEPLVFPNNAEVVKRCKAVEMGDPGYIVTYADGFVSWSPTKAFEQGYVSLLPGDCLKQEATELRDRIEKLETFLSGSEVSELDSEDHADLRMQYVRMEDYLRILNRRLRRANRS